MVSTILQMEQVLCTTNAPQLHVTSSVALHPNNEDWVAYSNDMLNYSENKGASWKTYQQFPNLDVMPLGTKMVQAIHWYEDTLFIGVGDIEEMDLELYQTTSLNEEAELVYTYQKTLHHHTLIMQDQRLSQYSL